MKKRSAGQSPRVDQQALINDNDAYRRKLLYDDLVSLPDVIIQTDLNFYVTGWNESAEKIYGLPGAMGKNLFEMIDIHFASDSKERMLENLKEKRTWQGHIHFTRFDGLDFHFLTNIHYIINEKEEPVCIIITNSHLRTQLLAEQKLLESDAIYKATIDMQQDGILLIGESGTVNACNKKALELLLMREEELLGKLPVGSAWKIYKPDGSIFPDSELPVIVSLQTGFPQKDVQMRIERPGGSDIWLSVSTQALIREGQFNPYAVIATLSDVS
jgi:PAS domain S-box-containing protein